MNRIPRALLAFHAIFVLFMLAPLIMVVLVAFTSKGYVSLPFDGASLRWFRAIFDHPEFIAAFQRSVGLAAGSATMAVLLAVPAGMAIAWHRFKGREALLGLLLSPLMVPPIVLGIALLRSLSQIGGSGSIAGLVAAHTVVVVPYVLRLVVACATGVDRNVAHAGESLGASPATVFWRIELPMILPGIAGGWLIAFITSFDELSLTIFVASPSTQTLPVMMYAYIANTIDPLLASISTVMLALTLGAMFLLERLFGLERVLGGKA